MKHVLLFLVTLTLSQSLLSQVVINELDCDTPSTDTQEFVELKTPLPNTVLDGYVLVFFNGSSSGMDSSYYSLDLDGAVTDENGLLLIGAETVTPFPQLLLPPTIIQQGADAVAIYQGNDYDFPGGTLATTTNLIDALVYDTSDADDTGLLTLLGETNQINENQNNNKTTESIQLNNDGTTYNVTTPTPRQLNDGSGIVFKPIEITTSQTNYNEGETFAITFSLQGSATATADFTFSFTLQNNSFTTADYTGNTTVTIPSGQSSVTTNITLVDDTLDEGDEEILIKFETLTSPYIAYNNYITLRAVDNDFVVAPYGTPVNPTYSIVQSTQPVGYYDTLNGLSGTNLKQAIQDIVANPTQVRAQSYADVIDILKNADVNPQNSNQVWLLYTEQGRAKLDFQTTSSNVGKWNREHTFPRSLGGFSEREEDEEANGINIFWTTKADSTRHAYSDAHALRATDGPENSSRGNQHYGQYNGPTANQGSFKGDVARSVLFLELRYNGLSIENGYPSTTGQMGDLATLLDWHRNDLPDDFEMNRNNVVYTWQFNRNPLIDMPDLVEYIWGNNVGNVWNNSLNTTTFNNQDITFYPNPVSDKLFIKGLKEGDYELIIFSTEGRKMHAQKINNNALINLNLPSGLYIAHIKNKDKQVVKKLIIR